MFRKSVLVSFFLTLMALGGCGGTNPVQVSPQSTTQQYKAAELKVRNAIIRAGHQHGWRMKILNQGKILATRYKRGFMASTEIHYTPRNYTLNFKSASNKSYYEEWVEQLDDEIQTQLSNS